MKQFVTKYTNIIPDSMDYVYVLIKLDLDLLNACRRAKQGLLESLRNPELFSREWISAFSDESFTPLESDSKRIVDLKKIILGLTQLEQCLEHLDDLHDILDLGGDDRNRVLFSIRLMSILGPATYLMTDVLGMIHAIQQSPNAIDVLLGESVTPLMSQLNRLFLSIHASDLAGASSTWMPVAMSWFKTGEVHSDNPGLVQLSNVIFRLPDYLHDLQQWLDPTPANEASTHVEHSARRKSQSDAFFKSLERLSTSNSAPILSLIVATRALLDHLPSVLNAAGPLSETMYLKTEEVLNQLRHVYFPEILAELEALEERLSLRPNALVEPTFGAMQSLYDAIYTLPSTLEQTSSHLKTVADGLSSKSVKAARRLLGNKDAIQIKKIDGSDRLRLMQDEEFSNRLNSMRLARYATAYERSIDDTALKAIDAFFHTASLCAIPYLYFFPSSLVQSVTMLSEWSDRLMNPEVNELVEKYQQIQPYYAALYPRMDVLFVTDLDAWLKKNASLLQADAMRSSIRTFAKQEQNQYKLICSYIESYQMVRDAFYADKIQQAQSSSIVESPESSVRSPEMMQISPRSDSLKTPSDDGYFKSKSFSFSSVGSSVDSEETPVLLTFDERIADVQQRVQEKRQIHSVLEELRTLGDQPRYKPWLDQVFSMKPADSLERFIQQDFKTWASTHLDEAVYRELTFEPSDISASVVCNGEVLMHQHTPVVMLYRKMLFVLNALQKNLRTIEKAYNIMKAKEDADPFRANYRWDFLTLLLKLDLSYLACFISDIQQSPVLHEWMQQALTSLTPLEGIPMIGEVIQSMKAPSLIDNAAIDVVARWQYEKKRVQYTLEGWPLMDDLLTRQRGVGMNEPNIETKECDAEATPLNYTTAFAPVLAERLHQLSAALRRIHASTAGTHVPVNLDEKITTLFAHVSGAGLNRKTLSSIVSLVGELTNILVGLHEEAKVASLIALRQVCAKLGAELISLADETEFQLCFEPGVLSNECAEVFYQFYRDLGTTLPISYNEKMQWIDSVPLMLHRVSIAQKRLNDAELSQRADIRADELVLHEQYAILLNMKGDSTMASRDFNRLDQQEKLLRVYQLLQPYVHAINPNYDLSYFLRTLKKSCDFEALYERLQSMQGSLFQLVEQKKIYYAQMMEKRRSHCAILNENAIKEQRRAGLKKDFLIHMHSNSPLKAMPRELEQQLDRFIEKNLALIKRNSLTRFQKRVKESSKTDAVKLAFGSLDEVSDAFLSMVSSWGALYIREKIQRDLENNQSQTLLRSGCTQALVQQCAQTAIAVYGTWLDQCCAINQEIAAIANADASTSPYAKIRRSDLEQMKAYLFQQDLSPEARVLGSGLDCYYDLRKLEQRVQASSLAIELASCHRISEDTSVKVQTKINNIKALLCNNDLNMADRLQKIVGYCLKEDTVQAFDAFFKQTSGGISNVFFKSSPDHDVKAFLTEIDAISKKTWAITEPFEAAEWSAVSSSLRK